ncbi:hypothetical protein PR202_ga06238 [Eleusine coracana subsp. coracana]|uniref:Phospholipid/glycerol acyltransferase domain-containing protein n=1 Tax=Eleusine coracana subsp. coracana TaxID=191504 RepID=A0AAV5BWP9_ELECO|nr:hypothetical protein QOZ80_2AG0099140 [Eleusine coracana subsp. coracana]GJM90003.1 hypothetical protein PR202_ga06238 [Eleusine coracana subsp. coracana]
MAAPGCPRFPPVEAVARGVLPRHYAAGVRGDTWAVFRGCDERRVVITASPAVMVAEFVREFLGAEVAGTELETVSIAGEKRFTGRIEHVLVGERKKEVVQRLFSSGDMPDVGLGDRESDHDFMAICKEAYMVPPDRRAPRAAADTLLSQTIFHDGRLVRRPDPAHAFFALAYLPVGFFLALFRVFFNLLIPVQFVRHTYRLTGINLVVRGTPPPAPRIGCPRGSLFVCNHRTALDPIIISIALGRPVTCVTYSVSRLSTAISPIRAASLTRDRKADAARMAALLEEGDVVVCPEGTTCREPFLLRFSALFAELTDRIVPVAVDAHQSTYYGSTARGCKWLDPYFFYMNPRPGYKVTFLPPLRSPQETCCSAGGNRSAVDVANHVQRVIAKELGFQCTALTRKDKYMKLAGNDGTIVDNNNKPANANNKSL